MIMGQKEVNLSLFIDNQTGLSDALGIYGDTQWARITVTVLAILAFVFGTPGNISVVIIVLTTPILKTWDNSFHVNLAVIDLIICVFTAPFSILLVWWWGGSFFSKCDMVRSIIFGPAVNMVILANISVLRSYKICHPHRKISKATMKVGIVFPWVVGFGVSTLDVLREKEYPFIIECHHEGQREVTLSALVPLALICGIVMLVSYITVFRKLMRQRLAIKPYVTGYTVSTITGSNTAETSFTTSDQPGTVQENPLKRQFEESMAAEVTDVMTVKKGADEHYVKLVQKDEHVICSSLILLGVYILSVLPAIITNRLFSQLGISGQTYGAAQVTTALSLINSFLNPFIYSLRTRVVRKRLTDFTDRIRKGFRQNSVTVEENFI